MKESIVALLVRWIQKPQILSAIRKNNSSPQRTKFFSEIPFRTVRMLRARKSFTKFLLKVKQQMK